MRTTVQFDDDTKRAIEELRHENGIGVSEAVNKLIRRAMLAESKETTYRPIYRDLGVMIDVSNVADALDILEGPGRL